MPNKKATVELDTMNVAQKKDLLGNLLSSLVADIDPVDRQKFRPPDLERMDDQPHPRVTS